MAKEKRIYFASTFQTLDMPTIRSFHISFPVILGLLFALQAQGQASKELDPMTPPPNFFAVSREFVKPGKDLLYNEIETDGARVCGRMKCPNSYLAISSITGPSQVWWLTPFDSYLDLERIASGYGSDPALLTELAHIVERKADIVTPPELLYAEYRKDLSHDGGLDLRHARFLSITSFKIAPGRTEEFEQLQRLQKSAYERAGVEDGHWVYQVFSGGSDYEFFVIRPLVALSDLERVRDSYSAKFQAAIGPSRADIHRLTAAAILSSTTYLFTPNPAWSYLPKDWIATDPQFWDAPAVKEK